MPAMPNERGRRVEVTPSGPQPAIPEGLSSDVLKMVVAAGGGLSRSGVIARRAGISSGAKAVHIMKRSGLFNIHREPLSSHSLWGLSSLGQQVAAAAISKLGGDDETD